MTNPTDYTVFLSLPGIADPSQHRAYNEWHQLDHFPENRALDVVACGERWVRSPDCRAVETVQRDEVRAADYFSMYWLRPPARDSVPRWQALGETTMYGGRRQDLAWTTRSLLGFFTPVTGMVAPGTAISLAALPHRPSRGLYVSMAHVPVPNSPELNEACRWYEMEALPQVLALPGVAGYWSLMSNRVVLPDGVTLPSVPATTAGVPGSDATKLLVRLFWLDEDPVAVAERVAQLRSDWPAEAEFADGVLEPLWDGPLRSIIPWQWDWFENPAQSSPTP